MDQAAISAIASELLNARRSASPVQRPSERFAMTLSDGYAVAHEILQRRLAAGETVVGVKLGFTNPSVWPSVGLTGPLWAPVFTSNYSEDAAVQLSRLRAPEVEPELVFGIGPNARLTSALPTQEALMAQIEWWALGLEIIDTGYPAGKPVVADQVADHCAHQKLIVGPRRPFQKIDPEILAEFSCELFRDGEMLCAGTGSNVMDNPLNAVEWFLRNRSEAVSWPEKVPTVLTTGRLANPPPLPTGVTQWELRSTLPLPRLSVSISRPD